MREPVTRWRRTPNKDGNGWLSLQPGCRDSVGISEVEPVIVKGQRVKIRCVTVYLDMGLLKGARWLPRLEPSDPFLVTTRPKKKRPPWHAPQIGEKSGYTYCGIYYRKLAPGTSGPEFFYRSMKVSSRGRMLAQTS